MLQRQLKLNSVLAFQLAKFLTVLNTKEKLMDPTEFVTEISLIIGSNAKANEPLRETLKSALTQKMTGRPLDLIVCPTEADINLGKIFAESSGASKVLICRESKLVDSETGLLFPSASSERKWFALCQTVLYPSAELIDTVNGIKNLFGFNLKAHYSLIDFGLSGTDKVLKANGLLTMPQSILLLTDLMEMGEASRITRPEMSATIGKLVESIVLQ
jgi:hypothetical protein